MLGVPALIDNLAIVYNKTLFDEAGLEYPNADWTWDDFRAAAKALTDPAKKQFGFSYPMDASEDSVWHYDPLLWQNGGSILNEDNTQAAFNSPEGRRGARGPRRDGGRGPVGLPRPAELAVHGPVQQREDRDAR